MCLILGAVYLPDCLLLLNFRLCCTGFSNWFVCIALQQWWSLTQRGVGCIFQSIVFFSKNPYKKPSVISQCLVVFWGEKRYLSLLQGAYSGRREFDDTSLLLFFLNLLLPSVSRHLHPKMTLCEVVFNMKSNIKRSLSHHGKKAIHIWCKKIKKKYLLYLLRGLNMPCAHTTTKMNSNPHRLPSSTTLTSKVEKAPTLCSRMYNHKSEILKQWQV